MRSLLKYVILCLPVFYMDDLMAQPGFEDNLVIFTTEEAAPDRDSNKIFIIGGIHISGNERTKPETILRELPFEDGHTYYLSHLVEKFYEAKKNLMNTGLFRNVIVSLRNTQGQRIYISVEVEERWYIYPLPFIKPNDQSFLSWATRNDRDFAKLSYGMRISHQNFTGRNDRLFVAFMNGFTKKVEIDYKGINLDKARKWYSQINLQYGRNREVNYQTVDNRVLPLKKPDGYVHDFFRSSLAFTYRKAIKTRHTFGFGYDIENVSDSVMKLNPDFLPGGSSVAYLHAFYKMSHIDVDFIPYPTQGHITEVAMLKKGFNNPIDLWQLIAKTSAFWPVAKKSFLNLRLIGTLKLPFKQPYIMQHFLGHGMAMQGYEDYIIDGVAGGYAKASFTHPIMSSSLRVPVQKISNKFQRYSAIPFKIFAKAFVNTGYIHNPNSANNLLNNRMLYSGGIGLDIVTFTDFVIKIEWSFNQLGQNGLYLHPHNNF